MVNTSVKPIDSGPAGNHPKSVADALSAQMAQTSRGPRCTKRTAARISIMNIIRSGIVKPGDLLPSEIELTKILGVSLGTVQAALRGLQDIGTIVRRRGDGTRVASGEPFAETIWHFRFMSREDGSPLRITDQKTRVDTVSTHGIWSDHLGQCAQYVRIWRILTLQNNVQVGAEMFLDSSLAKGLGETNASDLTHINIRPYLEETFGLTTARASHFVQTTELSRKTARKFNLSPEGIYYEIHAKTFSATQTPIYFQRIFAAINDCALLL
ncbi:MAG: GntR family transcriptional regulator [Rhodobacteraceae bacterium]|nr:GntR family transcriptional regulator [Paracoccaceae bacterium]